MVLSSTEELKALRDHPKKRRINRKKLSNYFTEYCESTSIHGFKYLGEQDRTWIEKIWWFLTIFVSLGICILLIIETYKKWIRSPVIVTFATKQTPIWQIPFPAVTICPETKSHAKLYNITEKYYHFYEYNNNITKKMRQDFEAISLICEINKTTTFKTRFTDDTVVKFMKKISPTVEEMFRRCEWRGKEIPCKDHFTPILTDEGICFTFNMLDRSEIYKGDVWHFEDFLTSQISQNWSLEAGYAGDMSKDSYPLRALYSGAKSGLDLEVIVRDEDQTYVCGEALQGFKVLLHNPGTSPRVSEQFFRLPLNQAVVAAVTPDMMTTSKVLLNYDPLQRLCYFPHEKKLRFFQTYSQTNCELECLANFTLQRCGCVDFHMPKVESTKICGAARLKCMQWAESKLLSDEIDAKLKREEEELKSANESTKILDIPLIIGPKKTIAEVNERNKDCNCLPSCMSLNYATETSQNEWKWYKQFADIKYDDAISFNTMEYRLAKLLIFFKDNQFVASERDELVNSTDFLANCGGLLGLFTGFSFISLVEIIYFLSLRFVCNIRKYGRKNWTGSVKAK